MSRLSSIAIALLFLLVAPPTQAQRDPDWVFLGEQTVGKVERDVINIGQPEDWFANRWFRALYFVAERTDVYLISVRLVYINGYTEDLRIDEFIARGDRLEVRFDGDRSYLKAIEMIYRARPELRGEAVIKVFADPVRRRGDVPQRGDWSELGCQQVALFGRDRDSIRVGRREGRFRAVRLLAREADVELLSVRVVYDNGSPDEMSIQQVLRAGERTRPLDLRGRERSIDRIDLVYRTALNPGAIISQGGIRTAIVCVEGLQ
ncbi:MAG TPA: hypothetical protein VNL39_06130 [Xanthobacteraceae bacterium]|nr:hypothetical protein [Xanthobacteraceae bacterium]